MDKLPEQDIAQETYNQIKGRHARAVKNHNLLTYAWASQFLIVKYGYKLADYGGGRGDGAMILSNFTKSIDIYDGHKGQLKLAQRHDYFCPVKFIKLNFETDKLPDEEYDAIVMFETLEHLNNPEEVVKHISKKCKLFIFSVPYDCATHHRKHYQWHQIHKQLFKSADDVYRMLGDNFKSIELYYERKAIIKKEPFNSPSRYIGICRT